MKQIFGGTIDNLMLKLKEDSENVYIVVPPWRDHKELIRVAVSQGIYNTRTEAMRHFVHPASMRLALMGKPHARVLVEDLDAVLAYLLGKPVEIATINQ